MSIMIDDGKSMLYTDPQVLAWIGDAYLTLAIRVWLMSNSNASAGVLHTRMKKYISAAAQARKWEEIYESLTEEEKDLGRRARNRHTVSSSKNSSLADYKKATALEAVTGYLYLKNDLTRLNEIFEMIIQQKDKT
jgi:ribonuclease-3 family protein